MFKAVLFTAVLVDSSLEPIYNDSRRSGLVSQTLTHGKPSAR